MDPSQAADLSAPAEQSQTTPDGPPQVHPFRTAFLVVQHPNGKWQATPDLNIGLSLEHPADPDEMYAGCAVAMKDLAALEAAQASVGLQMQIARQHAEAQTNAALLANLPDLPGGGTLIG